MTDARAHEELYRMVRTFGADFGRWDPEPAAAARRALLSDPAFRRAWESECALDARLGSVRDDLADRTARSGAVERVRIRTLRRIPAHPLAGMPWQRIAAAVLLAGMLGAAMDLMLIQPDVQGQEAVALDPLEGLGGVELQ